jgi:hypothetical protein
MAESTAVECQRHEELLFRQVHPKWVLDGHVASTSFAPNTNDKGLMSIDRGSLVDPAESFRRYLESGLQTGGTWAVTVGECAAEELRVFEDPTPTNDAHGFVDFRNLTNGSVARKSKKLRAHAMERGRLHPLTQSADG